jgi:uncharacterized protein YjbI with pentapeptide repeats
VKTVAPAGPILNSREMFRCLVIAGGLAGLLALGFAPAPALAGCTDPPAPGVNWQRCIQDGLEFRGVDLTGARLRSTSFFRADLSGSDLSEVNGFEAKFVNAIMRNVTLDGAKLSQADFTKADLSGASLVGADLRRARFFSANLRDADLTDARLQGADLTRADLSGATWQDGQRICAEGSVGRCN